MDEGTCLSRKEVFRAVAAPDTEFSARLLYRRTRTPLVPYQSSVRLSS